MSTTTIGGLIDPGAISAALVDPSLSMDLNVIGQSPSPGSGASGTVGQVSVQFDRPVDPFSLGFADIQIFRVGADGQLTPMIGDSTTLVESLDPSGTILTATLPQALAPGHYQLALSSSSFLTGTDGSMPANIGVETPLGAFDVLPAAPTLADAIDLGRLSTNITTAVGYLNLQANPHDVALYRFTVTPQFALSRVGIEVSAQRIGSPLDAAILLLNSDGSSISYDDLGRPGATKDPYLFQGLKPGIYYVAVVGGQMGYGMTGHFDAAHPPLPQANPNPASGIFSIQLVADPAETPAAMIGFGLLHQDPLDPNPTGFTLQFNAPLALTDSSGNLFDVMSRGVQVLDAHGRSWPIAGIAYDEATSTLTYVFRQQLPAGAYSVQIPSTGGLVDLSGHTPTAYGHPGGVFGRFAVTAAASKDGPGNLGSLYPDDILNNEAHSVVVPAGATVSLRFAILYSDLYKITTLYTGGALSASLLDPAEPTALAPPRAQPIALGAEGASSSFYHSLDWGVHVLTLTNHGTSPVTLLFRVGIGSYHWESLLKSGIGQGPALGLRLIAPGASSNASTTPSTASSSPASSGGAEATFPAAFSVITGGFVGGGRETASPPSATTQPAPALPAASPTGLYLAVGGQPVGAPAMLGPQGIGGGLVFVSPGMGTGFGQSASPAGAFGNVVGGSPAAPDVANVPGTDASPEDEVAPSDELAAIIAAARHPEGSLSNVTSIDTEPRPSHSDPVDGSLPDRAAEVSQVVVPEDRMTLEEATTLDPGLGFGLVAAVAVHYREAIRGWFSRFTRKKVRPRPVATVPIPRNRPSTRSREEYLSTSRISRAESRERMVAR